ncbi:MAG TPA: addiction module protein [Candidatus Thermoplasmatota archaeon]|nr:addiction module protein [Candidatus Thermoplasmatota archaeon]
MPPRYSTITLRSEVKDRLALLKGSRSWDDFLTDVAGHVPPDAAIEEMERRLGELRSGKVKGVPWTEVKAGGGPKRPRRRT